MTIQRRRIEILVDQPLVRRITETADKIGVTGYTLLPTLGGKGGHGRWTDDQLTGASAKTMFWTVTTDEKAQALVAALSPLLDSHGLLLTLSTVEVVREAKF
jgi:hypothetical protein